MEEVTEAEDGAVEFAGMLVTDAVAGVVVEDEVAVGATAAGAGVEVEATAGVEAVEVSTAGF